MTLMVLINSESCSHLAHQLTVAQVTGWETRTISLQPFFVQKHLGPEEKFYKKKTL